MELVARDKVRTTSWSFSREFDLKVLIFFDRLVEADFCRAELATHLHELHSERNLGAANISKSPDFIDRLSWLERRVLWQVFIDKHDLQITLLLLCFDLLIDDIGVTDQ